MSTLPPLSLVFGHVVNGNYALYLATVSVMRDCTIRLVVETTPLIIIIMIINFEFGHMLALWSNSISDCIPFNPFIDITIQ